GLEVLGRPVDGEVPGDRVLEALVALEDLLGAGDAAAREQGGEGALLRDLRIGETLPVGEVPGAGDAQGVVRGARDRDRVGDLLGAQAYALRGRGGRGIGALGGVVEALGAHGGDVAEAG